jgi:hypothetical protein
LNSLNFLADPLGDDLMDHTFRSPPHLSHLPYLDPLYSSHCFLSSVNLIYLLFHHPVSNLWLL